MLNNTYDSDGNLLINLTQIWDSVNGQWVNRTRGEITYNSDGNPISQLFQVWLGGWINWAKNTSTFDENDNQITELIEIWENGDWVNSNMSTYVYDAKLPEHWHA